MYVDDTGGTEDASAATNDDQMTVTVDGQDYQAEMTHDLSGDGVADTAAVENPDGSVSAFIDEDQDGDADHYIEVDPSGEVVAHAEYNEATGEWEAQDVSGGEATTTQTDTGTGGGNMEATLPTGERVDIGPPTIDTNGDGVPDTSMAEDTAGNTYYFTDVDNDGEADYVVIQNRDGSVEAYKHEGGSHWTPVDTGGASPVADAQGYAGGTGGAESENVAKIGGFSG